MGREIVGPRGRGIRVVFSVMVPGTNGFSCILLLSFVRDPNVDVV
jgi:hypothetical protein